MTKDILEILQNNVLTGKSFIEAAEIVLSGLVNCKLGVEIYYVPTLGGYFVSEVPIDEEPYNHERHNFITDKEFIAMAKTGKYIFIPDIKY